MDHPGLGVFRFAVDDLHLARRDPSTTIALVLGVHAAYTIAVEILFAIDRLDVAATTTMDFFFVHVPFSQS